MYQQDDFYEPTQQQRFDTGWDRTFGHLKRQENQSMTDHTYSDRLLNSFNAKAQDWGAATEDQNLDGRSVLRRRDAYYKARKELEDYVRGLERTIVEGDEQFNDVSVQRERLEGQVVELNERIQHLQLDNLSLANNVNRLSKEIEGRNRLKEQGPDEIAREYIMRTQIPELIQVYNRTVLGK